jgi:hypothetical protein
LERDLGEICISHLSHELSYVYRDYARRKKKLREKEVVRLKKRKGMNKYKWKKRMTEWGEFWRRVLFEEYSRMIDCIIGKKK